MKVTEQNSPVESGGLQQVHAFTIKASAKAFKALSSTLYKNKPLAIIREICANATDANVAAGTDKYKFDLHLPTVLDTSLIIRDYGKGMSHNDMVTTYTTYFESTKTETNDEVGCHGLGSKTPFSYTESFTVTSRHNGIKSLYAAYINATGAPDLAFISSEPSDEPSGLEVLIPTRQEDRTIFIAAADEALLYYEEKPNLTGAKLDWKRRNISMSGNGWVLQHKIDKVAARPMAVQGVIAYPIIISDLQESSKELLFINNLNIDIVFPIGTLEVALSRESLSYDAQTRKAIIDRAKLIYDEISARITNEVSAQPSFWLANVEFKKYTQFNSLLFVTPPSWRDKSLVGTQNVTVRVEFPQYISVREIQYRAGSYMSSSDLITSSSYNYLGGEVDIDISPDVEFFLNDIGRTASGRIKKYLAQRNKTIILLEHKITAAPLDKNYKDPVKALMAAIGDPVLRKISDLEKPDPVKRPKSDLIHGKVFDHDAHMHRTGKNWKQDSLSASDLTKGGMYIEVDDKWAVGLPTSKHAPIRANKQFESSDFNKFIKWLKITRVLNHSDKLFAFRKTTVSKLDKRIWHNAFVLFENWLNNPKLDAKVISTFENWYDCNSMSLNNNTIQTIKTQLPAKLLLNNITATHPLNAALDKIVLRPKHIKFGVESEMKELQTLLHEFSIDERLVLNGKERPITELFNIIDANYPLMQHISLCDQTANKILTDVAKYVALIDAN